MIITRHDKPIGQARAGGLRWEPDRRTIAAVAHEHGIWPESVYNFRRRHPGLDWSVERITAQIVANKDQSSVARRQGCAVSADRRNKFGCMRYEVTS